MKNSKKKQLINLLNPEKEQLKIYYINPVTGESTELTKNRNDEHKA